MDASTASNLTARSYAPLASPVHPQPSSTMLGSSHGSSIDPILARYINLKRQMDGGTNFSAAAAPFSGVGSASAAHNLSNSTAQHPPPSSSSSTYPYRSTTTNNSSPYRTTTTTTSTMNINSLHTNHNNNLSSYGSMYPYPSNTLHTNEQGHSAAAAADMVGGSRYASRHATPSHHRGNVAADTPLRRATPPASSFVSQSLAAGASSLPQHPLQRDMAGHTHTPSAPHSFHGNVVNNNHNNVSHNNYHSQHNTQPSFAHDARAILQSPKASVGVGIGGVGGGAGGGISPSLRRRLETRAEAEAQHMSAQSAETRRLHTDVELNETRLAMKEQQYELDDALGKLEASERTLRSTRDALERAEEARAELEVRLATAVREAEMAKSTAKSQGISTTKVLEGRVAALQSEVLTREDALKAAALRQHDLEEELRRRDLRAEALIAEVKAAERRSGEASLAAEELRSEINRLKKSLEDVSVESRLRDDRFEQQEAMSREREMAMEKAAMNAKEEIRSLNRRLSELEVDNVSVSERLREAESAAARSEAEARELRVSLEEHEATHRDTTAKLETLRARSAQDSIIADQSRFETEQARMRSANLKREVEEKDARIRELEMAADRGEEERRMRVGLEAQLTAQTSQLDRTRDEYDHARKRLEDYQKRTEFLSREAEAIPHLKEKIAELQSLVEAKNAAIEKKAQVEQRLREDHSAAASEVKLLNEHKSQLIAENQRLDAELKSKNAQIDSLTEEVKKKNALYGEIEGLGQMLRERDERISTLISDAQQWQHKCRELDEDIDTLLDVKRQFDDLVANHRAVFGQLEERNRELEALKGASDAMAEQLALRDQETRELNAILLESDDRVQKLTHQVSDKASIESRLRQTSSELSAVRAELTSEKDKREETRAKIQQRDEQFALERAGRTEAEERSTRLQEELADVQVQLGKATVRLEGFEKECRRLTNEYEVKNKQMESIAEDFAFTKKELQKVEGEARDLQYKHAHITLRSEHLSAEVARLEAINSELAAAAKAGDEKGLIADQLNEKLRTCELQLATLESRLTDATSELKERTQQINENTATISRLQSEIANYEKTNQRLTEIKQLADKQSLVVDALEKEDASKSRQLMDKEREVSRLREKVALLGADLETERNKKRSLENRVKDLEKECERASTLDGQVAGLNMVIQQRSRALEEEQNANKELRARLSRVAEHHTTAIANRSSSSASRSRAGSVGHDSPHTSAPPLSSNPASAIASLESRLAVKEEIIKQLEAEEKRRQALLEDLREELRTTEGKLHQTEVALREARSQLATADGEWAKRYSALDEEMKQERKKALASARGSELASSNLVEKLEEELKEARNRAAALSKALHENRERELGQASERLVGGRGHRDFSYTEKSIPDRRHEVSSSVLHRTKGGSLPPQSASISPPRHTAHTPPRGLAHLSSSAATAAVTTITPTFGSPRREDFSGMGIPTRNATQTSVSQYGADMGSHNQAGGQQQQQHHHVDSVAIMDLGSRGSGLDASEAGTLSVREASQAVREKELELAIARAEERRAAHLLRQQLAAASSSQHYDHYAAVENAADVKLAGNPESDTPPNFGFKSALSSGVDDAGEESEKRAVPRRGVEMMDTSSRSRSPSGSPAFLIEGPTQKRADQKRRGDVNEKDAPQHRPQSERPRKETEEAAPPSRSSFLTETYGYSAYPPPAGVGGGGGLRRDDSKKGVGSRLIGGRNNNNNNNNNATAVDHYRRARSSSSTSSSVASSSRLVSAFSVSPSAEGLLTGVSSASMSAAAIGGNSFAAEATASERGKVDQQNHVNVNTTDTTGRRKVDGDRSSGFAGRTYSGSVRYVPSAMHSPARGDELDKSPSPSFIGM